MKFMHEGGVFMWIILVAAIVALALAATRRGRDGWLVALQGSAACLAFGLLGFAIGLGNVIRYLNGQGATDPQRWEILMVGMSETINNAIFGGGWAIILGIASIVLAPRRSGEAAAMRQN